MGEHHDKPLNVPLTREQLLHQSITNKLRQQFGTTDNHHSEATTTDTQEKDNS